jgi:hypothetical protein
MIAIGPNGRSIVMRYDTQAGTEDRLPTTLFDNVGFPGMQLPYHQLLIDAKGCFGHFVVVSKPVGN